MTRISVAALLALGCAAGEGETSIGPPEVDQTVSPPPAQADAMRDAASGAVSDAVPVRDLMTQADAAPPSAPADMAPLPDVAVSAPADAAPRPDAARDPLNIPAGQWSAVMIEGMTCADGTPTGIAVNPAPDPAARVFIYLIGGGACWDYDTCYREPRAAFIEEPMLPQAFLGSDLTRVWFFDRANADNPFAADHLVFVPYCTGDIHAGDRVAVYEGRETRHAGATNFARLAARLSAAWPETTRVVLSGGSAGGYGAAMNWQRALGAFPNARVDVVDDSGPPLPPPHLRAGLLATWALAWDLPRTVPADCPDCLRDLSAHVSHGLARARGGRFGLLSSTGDGVIASYLGLDAAGLERGLQALQAGAPVGYGAYLVPGDSHVLMGAAWVAGGQTIPGWIRALLADDPAWGSVGPDPFPERCDGLADCGGCAVCSANGPCQAEYQACNAHPGCVDAVVCALGCAANDQGCITGCAAAHDALRQEALELYTCARCRTCPGPCGACP